MSRRQRHTELNCPRTTGNGKTLPAHMSITAEVCNHHLREFFFVFMGVWANGCMFESQNGRISIILVEWLKKSDTGGGNLRSGSPKLRLSRRKWARLGHRDHAARGRDPAVTPVHRGEEQAGTVGSHILPYCGHIFSVYQLEAHDTNNELASWSLLARNSSYLSS